jgi:uncharacterized heparinase superfamily protein
MEEARLARLKKIAQTPFPVLLTVAAIRVRRRLASSARRARQKLPSRAPTGAVRDDRAFFCADDITGARRQFLDVLMAGHRQSLEANTRDADKALKHVFDLLGSGECDLGARINWHQDFKSGREWPVVYHEDIPEVDFSDDSDIKVPWELSRFYHFVTMGKAYVCTGNEAYTREFLSQLDDWTACNPAGYGVNWRLAMEVAIRAINLCWAYFLFRGSELFTAERRARVASLLVVHGRYIRHNLEFDRRVIAGKLTRMNGNHYLADLAGLVYLGVLLRGREAEGWLRFALGELKEELATQVLRDGAHWELSPHYHRLVLEMLMGCGALCMQNGIALPALMGDAVRRMLSFTEACLAPSGLCPRMRDADDGRITPLGLTEYRDHRHLLALGAVLFGDGEVPASLLPCSEDVLWMLGIKGYRKLHARADRPRASVAFGDAGYYVMRKDDDVHLLINCATVGMGGNYGGHSHCDCLSFELFWNGVTFITDSGTYGYSGSPSWRNRFRSTAFHNTACVDGAEINRFQETVLFAMENDAKPRVNGWSSGDDRDELDAEHYGYARLSDPVTHRRRFTLDKRERTLLLVDDFIGAGAHAIDVFFTVDPCCAVTECGPRLIQIRHEDACVLLSFDGGDGWDLRVTEGWVSGGYGRKTPTRKVALSRKGSIPCTLRSLLVLTSAPCPDPRAVMERAFASKTVRGVGA